MNGHDDTDPLSYAAEHHDNEERPARRASAFGVAVVGATLVGCADFAIASTGGDVFAFIFIVLPCFVLGGGLAVVTSIWALALGADRDGSSHQLIATLTTAMLTLLGILLGVILSYGVGTGAPGGF
jgi:hypothetical protein